MAVCFCGPNRLASAGSGNVIYLWDTAARRELARLVGHVGSITTLVFHPETSSLVSGGYDTTIRVWNVGVFDEEKITQR